MYMQILVPVDVSDIALAKPAIDAACAQARISGGAVRLVHVLATTPVMLTEYVPPDFEEQQSKSAEQMLEALAQGCALPPSRVSYTVRQGGIYHEVLEEAKDIEADLIVMSSHRPAMRTYYLGSNAGHVVRYAPCSVLVVRDARTA